MATPQQNQGGLRKELTLPLLVLMMIGLNIGGALFTLTSAATALAGPALLLAQVISAIPVLLAIVPYITITSSAPKSAASYQYAKLFNYPLAVSALLVIIVAMLLGGLPLYALTAGKFVLMLIPGAPQMVAGSPIYWDSLIGIITLIIFYVINIFGIKPTAIVQGIMVSVMILALLIFIFLGLPSIKMSNFSPFFTADNINLLAAAALSYTLLAGGLFGIELGDEVLKAHSTIPKALIIGLIIVITLYLFIELVALGTVGWETFAKGNLGTPAKSFMPQGLFIFFVIGGGILACITTVHAVLTIFGRIVMVFARDGFFPKVMATINQKYGTPHWGLTLPVVVSTVILLFVRDIMLFGAMLNFSLLFMVTLVLLAVFNLPKNYPEFFARSKYQFRPAFVKATALISCIMNLVFMLLLIMIMFKRNMSWAFWLFAITIVFGIFIYYVRKRQGAVRPVNMGEYQ